MKNILIIANFISIMPWQGGNNRFTYLANLLSERGHNVELVTSSFSHAKKCQKKLEQNEIKKLPYKLTNIYEPGYKKNVSVKRFYSHYILGKNIKKYLESLEIMPYIIYCAVPSLLAPKVAAKFAKKNNIKFTIDIQDLWPEAFKMVLNIPIISDIIFYPFEKTANYIYKSADDIIAVSETYVDRAVKVNSKYKNKLSVFLGTELSEFDRYKEENKIEYHDSKIRIAYIGTLGHSYDLKCIIEALGILKKQGIENIKFMVMGDGPLKSEFEKYAKEKNIDVEFLGRLEYSKMVGMLCACDIAVNPIKSKSAGSIINKVGDYAAAGLPVINTQECLEYRKMIENNKIGFNCKNNATEDLAEKLKVLINDKKIRNVMGKNNRKLAEEYFDRKKTYLNILNLVENNERKI